MRPNGSNVPVTNANRVEYIYKVQWRVEWYTCEGVGVRVWDVKEWGACLGCEGVVGVSAQQC